MALAQIARKVVKQRKLFQVIEDEIKEEISETKRQRSKEAAR